MNGENGQRCFSTKSDGDCNVKWTLVCITTRTIEECEELQSDVNWLWKCGAIEAERVLVVEDPCVNLGSGGSSLNALLVAVEHLCARSGCSVLNEDVLSDARILIVHSGREFSWNRCGTGFMDLGYDVETRSGFYVPQTLFVKQLSQLGRLASFFDKGVWICGSDAFWKIDWNHPFGENFSLSSTADGDLLAFTFSAPSLLAKTSGVYRVNDQMEVIGIDYCSEKYTTEERVSLVLTVLYLPVRIATAFLSLHSVYPLSSCTYYGIDSGSPGLQLSIFFDFILAAARGVEEECYVSGFAEHNRVAGSKPHCEEDARLRAARRTLFRHFSRFSARVVHLNMEKYHYFQSADEKNLIRFWNTLNDSQYLYSIPQIAERVYLPGFEKDCYADLPLKKCFELNRARIFTRWFNVVQEVIVKGANRSLLPLFRALCALDGRPPSWALQLIDRLYKICEGENRETFADRALYSVAEVLALLSKQLGGLRSGPAANPSFSSPILLLQNDLTSEGLSAMRAELTKWINTPERLIRAARHHEAAAQVFIQRNVTQFCKKQLPGICEHMGITRGVRASAACRVDIAGGWSDTPPITMQVPRSAVLNLAVKVDAKKPIICEVRPLFDKSGVFIKELDVHFGSVEEIISLSSRPSIPGSLVCATLLAAGFVRPTDTSLSDVFARIFPAAVVGIEVSAYSSLPHGSGMGTSSILAAALLSALWTFMGVSFNNNSIFHAVLLVEQYLTTGGGWQDQVGGIEPGFKLSRFDRDRCQVVADAVHCTDGFIEEVNSRLALIYTGRTRLAKNLLQEVIRSWYCRDAHLTSTLDSLVTNAERAADLIRKGIFPVAEAEQYYMDKKRIAAGCEPSFVKKLIDDLRAAGYIEAAWLAGAGGGGFLYAWLTQNSTLDHIRAYLRQNEEYGELKVHSATVDMDPLQIELL